MKKMICALLMFGLFTTFPVFANAENQDVAVGDVIQFGQYEQDADESNGKEPIEWIALELDGDKVLLLSRYVLDRHQFHNAHVSIPWETCEARSWLNSAFLSEAFTESEQDAVIETTVDNSVDPHSFLTIVWGLNESADTSDKVFLLSVEEAFKYFPTHDMRKSEETEYVKHMSGKEDDCWMLRSTHFTDGRVLSVRNGNIMSNVVYDYNPQHYLSDRIRPALWLDLSRADSEDINILEGQRVLVGADSVELSSLLEDERVGKEVSFGSYEQDGDVENGQEPIEWIVLGVDGEQTLLLSKYALASIKFHNLDKKVGWEESNIRAWLNSDFYETAFTDNDKKEIITVKLENYKENSDGQIEELPATSDCVFLLSSDEVYQFLPFEETRICVPTIVAYGRDDAYSYWVNWHTRTPFDNLSNYSGSIFYVSYSGGIYSSPFMLLESYVRPSIWVSTEIIK